MKSFLYTFILLLCIFSCSEGDIISTEFNFDKDSLDLCEATTGNFIYFKINNQKQEGVSFNFTRSNFTLTTVDSFSVVVNSTNQFIYRKFNTQIDQEYYCGLLPDRDINVLEEFTAVSGTAIIESSITKENDTILNNDQITVTQDTYLTEISFIDLRLDGPDQQATYENLILEGTRVLNDTITK